MIVPEIVHGWWSDHRFDDLRHAWKGNPHYHEDGVISMGKGPGCAVEFRSNGVFSVQYKAEASREEGEVHLTLILSFCSFPDPYKILDLIPFDKQTFAQERPYFSPKVGIKTKAHRKDGYPAVQLSIPLNCGEVPSNNYLHALQHLTMQALGRVDHHITVAWLKLTAPKVASVT